MNSITVHMMVKNEEYWVGAVLDNVAQVFENIIVVDCGSGDQTPDILQSLAKKYHHIRLHLFQELDAAQNGAIRQWMTDRTKTDWAAIIDGDELYSVEALASLLDDPITDTARMTYSTLEVLDFERTNWVVRETWSKHLLFHVPTTTWRGPYPFEMPHPHIENTDPASRYYHPSVKGYDLHHLPRSPLDAQTRHRNREDKIRQLMPVSRYLPDAWSLLKCSYTDKVLDLLKEQVGLYAV